MKYGWMGVHCERMDGILDTSKAIDRVKEVWMDAGKTQEEVDSWRYILVPYCGDMIGVLYIF